MRPRAVPSGSASSAPAASAPCTSRRPDNIPGIHVVAIADINVDAGRRARSSCVDWPTAQLRRRHRTTRSPTGTTAIIADADELFDADIDVIVEATGNPIVGIKHALRAIETGKHIIMVTVEADALAGPALAQRAEAGGRRLLDGVRRPARAHHGARRLGAHVSGFDVVCAGKGAKYLAHYHEMNPDNVWENWEFSKELTDSGQLNPYMHTSFRDGTKAAIEMAAVANAAGLVPSDDGLTLHARQRRGDRHDLPPVGRSAACSPHEGTVDVMSSVTRDGDWIPHNTQEGVFVVVKATNDYVSGCFTEYPWHPDPTGQYAALYRPYHYVGLELNISIANAALRGVATGSPIGFYGGRRGHREEGPQRRRVPRRRGRLHRLGQARLGRALGARAAASRSRWRTTSSSRNDVAKGESVSWDDVDHRRVPRQALELRRETEALIGVSV